MGGPGSGNFRKTKLTSATEELTQAPEASTLGSIPLNTITNPSPSFSGWTAPGGEVVDIEDAPPPWETDRRFGVHNTDARQFVDVPPTWELRWISQRMLEHYGPRNWMAVLASDPKVTVKNRAMISPENYVRRGGQSGDLLFWMPRRWVADRARRKAEDVAVRTAGAVDRMQSVQAQSRSGALGHGYVTVDSVKHPTHTQGEGRSMERD